MIKNCLCQDTKYKMGFKFIPVVRHKMMRLVKITNNFLLFSDWFHSIGTLGLYLFFDKTAPFLFSSCDSLFSAIANRVFNSISENFQEIGSAVVASDLLLIFIAKGGSRVGLWFST